VTLLLALPLLFVKSLKFPFALVVASFTLGLVALLLTLTRTAWIAFAAGAFIIGRDLARRRLLRPGILIAAAFIGDPRVGVVTALAIVAHEIPQEVGDFLILLHSGYTKTRALVYNLLSSLATLVGGLLAWFALSSAQAAIPVLLALAAASMIYVAVADLIPGLHKRTELRATVQQVLLIAAGVASIVVSHRLVEALGLF